MGRGEGGAKVEGDEGEREEKERRSPFILSLRFSLSFSCLFLFYGRVPLLLVKMGAGPSRRLSFLREGDGIVVRFADGGEETRRSEFSISSPLLYFVSE